MIFNTFALMYSLYRKLNMNHCTVSCSTCIFCKRHTAMIITDDISLIWKSAFSFTISREERQREKYFCECGFMSSRSCSASPLCINHLCADQKCDRPRHPPRLAFISPSKPSPDPLPDEDSCNIPNP